MNNSYSTVTSDELDDYPKITQADLDRATFRVGLKPAPRKRRQQPPPAGACPPLIRRRRPVFGSGARLRRRYS